MREKNNTNLERMRELIERLTGRTSPTTKTMLLL